MNFKKLLLALYIPLAAVAISPDQVTPPTDWQPLTAKNTALFFDLDDTLIGKTGGKTGFKGLLWLRFLHRTGSLIGMNQRSTRSPEGNYQFKDKDGNSFDSVTPQMLYNAMQDKKLEPSIYNMLQFTARNHKLLPGAKNILTQLKKGGFECNIATNKDHYILYHTLRNLDKRTKSFSSYFTKVICTTAPVHIRNMFDKFAQQRKVSAKTKQVIHQFNNPTNLPYNFTVVEGYKPIAVYFDKMRQTTKKKYIIFFDDNAANVAAAHNPEKGVIAVLVKKPADIEKALKNLGIL